jgi:hypothetical protein
VRRAVELHTVIATSRDAVDTKTDRHGLLYMGKESINYVSQDGRLRVISRRCLECRFHALRSRAVHTVCLSMDHETVNLV